VNLSSSGLVANSATSQSLRMPELCSVGPSAMNRMKAKGLPCSPRPNFMLGPVADFEGVVLAAYLALRKKGGDSLIFTTSLSGLIPPPAVPVYAGAKAGIVGVFRSIAPAYIKRGIRVNRLSWFRQDQHGWI